ncbi:MAG: imidazole glycerol phosphate synthase subunit HisH [Caulobacteraceae bacterium]
MASVALIDYGSGNLRSAEKALQRAAAGLAGPCEVVTTSDPEVVASAERIVLPGVGAFRACMAALSARPGLVEAMTLAARGRGAPFLGICVGMQLLATRGLEFEESPGLGWIAGEVRRLAPTDRRRRIPHMGWNTLSGPLPRFLFAGLAPRPHMYFTHSFAFSPSDEADVLARCDHGGEFVAAVGRDNLAGVQFHPEKSQAAGLALLANFLKWRP